MWINPIGSARLSLERASWFDLSAQVRMPSA